MNLIEKTFREMLKKCISVLNDAIAIWGKNELIVADVEDLKKNDKEYDEAVEIQNGTKPEGQIAQKRQEMLTIGKLVYHLACSLCHLAKKSKDKALLKIVDLSENKFISGEEQKLILRMKAVLAAARENLSGLAKYNVTAADLDAYDAQLAKLIGIPDAINVASSQRKSATRTIKELNAEGRYILELLDDVFEGVIRDEKFIDDWFEARKIKGRHRSGKKGNGSAKKDVAPVK